MIEDLAIAGFVLAGLLGTFRLLRGPGLGDRIIALDVTVMSLMGAIAVAAARSGDTSNVVAVVVLAIIGFVATIAGSRFIEREPALARQWERAGSAGSES